MPDGTAAAELIRRRFHGGAHNTYRDDVVELLLAERFTAREIAEHAGNGCNPNYVRYVANMIGLQPLKHAERHHHHVAAKRELARMLEAQYRRQQALWGFK